MPRARTKPTKAFAVGDHVLVRFGPTSTMLAEILEDRGLIGHARRQYYRVRTIDTDPSEPIAFEVREEDLLPKPGRKVVR